MTVTLDLDLLLAWLGPMDATVRQGLASVLLGHAPPAADEQPSARVRALARHLQYTPLEPAARSAVVRLVAP